MTEGTDVVVVDNADAGLFEARLPDGAVAGVIGYRRRAGRLIFTHTEVEPAFEGRGIASTLARAALEQAHSEGATVVPLCPFVRAYLRRHADDYADLAVDGSDRA